MSGIVDQAGFPEFDLRYWNGVGERRHAYMEGVPSPNTPPWPGPDSSVAPKGDWSKTPEGMPLFVANWLFYLAEVVGCLECEARHQSLI